MSSPNRFSIRFTWREGGGKKCFSDSCILLFIRYVGKHARTHLHDWFLLPAVNLSTTLAMQKYFLIYFQSVICSHHSGNWQSTIVLLIKTNPAPPHNLIMRFPSLFSLTLYGLPTRFSQEEELWTAKRSHITLYPQCHCISKCGLLWCTSRLPTAKITWL